MNDTPQSIAAPPAEKANGLATYFKVIYAPGEAFATLARVPTWGWAAVIGIVLTLASTIIIMPATIHYTHVAQEQSLSQLTAEKAAAAREAMAKVPDWIYPVFGIVGSVIGPWFGWLLGADIFLIGAALGGGQARFGLAWVAAVNAFIIPALGSLIGGVAIIMRGAENINSVTDLYAIPSLAMLVHGSPKLAGFLYGFNVINLWYYVVAVIALEQTLKVSRVAAIATVLVFALLAACIGAVFAK